MMEHPAVTSILGAFAQSTDRYESHQKLQPLLHELSADKSFLHDAIRECLSRPGFLNKADRLALTICESGDIAVRLHLFAPFRDGAENISSDNIHHHGWRLLTTAVIFGGYHFIDFRRCSHENRSGDQVFLVVDRIADHVQGNVRTIDTYTPHVVFQPKSLCATLAVTSADRVLLNQNLKKRLSTFPAARKVLVRSAHASGLAKALGLNAVRGVYFHPEGGRIVETKAYDTSYHENHEEVLGCIFRFLQQVGFNDFDFLRELAKDAPPEASNLIKKLLKGEPLPDEGVWGNWRRRFSKTQILQAIDYTYPKQDAVLG